MGKESPISVPSAAPDARPQGLNFQKVKQSITDSLEGPQFWSAFISTVSATLLMAAGKQAFMKIMHKEFSINREQIAKVNEALVRGHEQYNAGNYQEACVSLKFAKDLLDDALRYLSQSNPRLYHEYANIHYSYALTLVGIDENDIALIVLDDLLKKQQQWNTLYFGPEIYNLMGIIHIKRGDYPRALGAFGESLLINSRQEEILLLQQYLKSNPDSKLEKKSNYTMSDKYFNLKNHPNHPAIAFEVNFAYLNTLFNSREYLKCFLKLKELEASENFALLPLADRSKIYQLFARVLQRIDAKPMPMKINGLTRDQVQFVAGLYKSSVPIGEEEKQRLAAEYKSQFDLSKQKPIRVRMLSSEPQEVDSNPILFREQDSWHFRNQSISSQDLLKVLKIKALSELPQKKAGDGQEYLLTYSQGQQVLKYFDDPRPQPEPRRFTLFAKGILGVSVLYGISALYNRGASTVSAPRK